MKTQIKRFLLTLGFMTRIPVNVDLGEVKDEDMHKGFLYYPVVGLILGLCDMAVFLLVSLILPEVFGILFAMLANLCLTGAFHLDGLSDTADGIYSARTRERMLEIMKDSRIGTNGAVAMCFDLALKFAGIYYSDIRWLMILLMPIAGKMVQGAIVYKAIYPREKGIGIYVGTVSLGTVIGTVILGLIAMVLAFSCPYLCDSLWIRLPFPCIYHRENRWNHRRCYGSRKRACGSIITACCYCSYKVYRNDTIIIISILVFKNEIMIRESCRKNY